MNKSYCPEVPAGLLEKVLDCVHEKQKAAAKRKTIFIVAAFLTSAASLVPSFFYFTLQASKTGFLNYSSLMFSDMSVVFTYWRNFSIALLETLPTLSLAIFLITLIWFLQSLKFLVKNIKYGRRFFAIKTI